MNCDCLFGQTFHNAWDSVDAAWSAMGLLLFSLPGGCGFVSLPIGMLPTAIGFVFSLQKLLPVVFPVPDVAVPGSTHLVFAKIRAATACGVASLSSGASVPRVPCSLDPLSSSTHAEVHGCLAEPSPIRQTLTSFPKNPTILTPLGYCTSNSSRPFSCVGTNARSVTASRIIRRV